MMQEDTDSYEKMKSGFCPKDNNEYTSAISDGYQLP